MGLTLEFPLSAVAFRGMVCACGQAVRPAGFGSRGCQSPGMAGTCVWSRRECGVRRSMTRAAAKRMPVIAENLTRTI
jgi:hypothetical protein